ncbi:putative chitin synthase export chaperone [Colletotrichum sublineola]|uniref:Putative chitin synthase export chaperone n=1 Tax=Colletotrichum sublineola TaxID=1173701 RepID=A0A066XJZ4_COLSU|nr:putative chitin synthase export chaperone [Colletotrichum sublineola]
MYVQSVSHDAMVLSDSHSQSGPWGGCELTGISLGGGRKLGNLGSILIAAFAIIVSIYLLLRSERKKAAVGRREMQLFLASFIVIEICEIFTVGDFPLAENVRIVSTRLGCLGAQPKLIDVQAFTGIHIGMIIASTWILMLNAIVGYQIVDDGTPLSMGLITASAAILLGGTLYITLDTGFQWTSYWNSSYQPPNRHIALYVLYQLAPLIFIVAFFVLETILVIRVLGEMRPMLYLTAALLLFAVGQIFNYVISSQICKGTNGAVDGALFQTFFTLLAVIAVWVFWSSITEDDWPMPVGNNFP